MKKLYKFFRAYMPEQKRSIKGIGISLIFLVAGLAIVFSSCSINAGERIDYLPVFSVENLENIPIEKNKTKDNEAWSADLKKYKKEEDANKRLYVKLGICRNVEIVDDYKKKHPEDIVLRKKAQDGQWIVKIWTDDELKNMNKAFVSMKK